MKNRNRLRCIKCKTIVLTDAISRYCYKCDALMEFIGKEGGK